jgi:hypothetical protein
MREQLKAFYLEYVNAYIMVQAMSDYKHMTEADTQACIDMGRRLHEEDATRAKTTPPVPAHTPSSTRVRTIYQSTSRS